MLPPLAYLDLFSAVLPLTGGLSRIRRVTGRMRLFYLLVFLSGAVELATYLMGRSGIHNLWLIQCYHLVDYVVVVHVLTEWQGAGVVRTVQRAAIPAYCIFWVTAKGTFEPLTGPDQFTYTIACILVLLTTIATIFYLGRDEDFDFLRDSRFWIAGGVLIYFAGNFVLYSVFEQFTMLPRLDAIAIWNVHWAINVIANVSYMAGFLLLRR